MGYPPINGAAHSLDAVTGLRSNQFCFTAAACRVRMADDARHDSVVAGRRRRHAHQFPVNVHKSECPPGHALAISDLASAACIVSVPQWRRNGVSSMLTVAPSASQATSPSPCASPPSRIPTTKKTECGTLGLLLSHLVVSAVCGRSRTRRRSNRKNAGIARCQLGASFRFRSPRKPINSQPFRWL